MANRFLNNIRINDEYTLPANDGSAGQAIVTDGSGNLSFGSAVASSADSSESIHITVKNTSGAQITKGTPVYVTGETGNSGKIEIAPADASDENKMPALGILESTLNNNAEGFCVQGGLLGGLSTATIDGTTTTANDTVYVKPGGGLTMTKPTGSNLIQNIAKVVRTHASNGSLVVSSILRTNDVPNLPEGRIWVGDGNTLVSDTVYIDEPNGRLGIGTSSPQAPLHLNSGLDNVAMLMESTDTAVFINLKDSGTTSDLCLGRISNDTVIYSGGSERFRIKSNGNIGIGITSPSEKLDLGTSGALKVTQLGVTEVYVERTGVRLKNIYTGGGWARGILTYENSGGTDYFQLGALGSSQDFTYAYIGPAYNTPWQVWTNTGNVGIGTTSPDTLLDVSSVNTGATAPTVRITNTRESGDWGGFTDDLGRFEFFTDDASGNSPYTLGYIGIKNDRTGSGTLPTGAMVLATTTYNAAGGAVERMRITSDGDVGIGTTTPSYKLDVNGDGRVDGTFRCVTLVQTSQRDQKENINNIDKSKAKVIPFKEYTYKSSIDGSARKRYGVIAEDIENDYPELVHTGADGVKGINYIDLLVKRVAELEKELEDISLTPGATGPQGPSGSNGNDGNSHLSNVDSITFDERANQLVLTINRTDFRFSPVR